VDDHWLTAPHELDSSEANNLLDAAASVDHSAGMFRVESADPLNLSRELCLAIRHDQRRATLPLAVHELRLHSREHVADRTAIARSAPSHKLIAPSGDGMDPKAVDTLVEAIDDWADREALWRQLGWRP
jgi:hypothetical protein